MRRYARLLLIRMRAIHAALDATRLRYLLIAPRARSATAPCCLLLRAIFSTLPPLLIRRHCAITRHLPFSLRYAAAFSLAAIIRYAMRRHARC